jgi:TPR repeat protein
MKTALRWLACVVPFVSLSFPAVAASLDDALAAYHSGDEVAAIRLLTPLAESGNVKAQDTLGDIYWYGDGTPADCAASLAWSQRSAELGSPEGANAMGFNYSVGQCIEQNDAKAVEWYRKGAAAGNVKSEVAMARRYLYGQGVPKDEALGLQYLRSAADGGYDRAQVALGQFILAGNFGAQRDDKEAARLFRLAAEQRNDEAAFLLGSLYAGGRGVDKDFVWASMWLNLAAMRNCKPAVQLRAIIAPGLDAAAQADAKALATAWDTSHPPRDPRIHRDGGPGICGADLSTPTAMS